MSCCPTPLESPAHLLSKLIDGISRFRDGSGFTSWQKPVCNLTSLVLSAALLCGCCSDTHWLCQYILSPGLMHCERRMRGFPRCWCACKALVQQQQPAQRTSLSLYVDHHRTALSLPMALLIAVSQQRNCLSLAIYAAEGIFLDI